MVATAPIFHWPAPLTVRWFMQHLEIRFGYRVMGDPQASIVAFQATRDQPLGALAV